MARSWALSQSLVLSRSRLLPRIQRELNVAKSANEVTEQVYDRVISHLASLPGLPTGTHASTPPPVSKFPEFRAGVRGMELLTLLPSHLPSLCVCLSRLPCFATREPPYVVSPSDISLSCKSYRGRVKVKGVVRDTLSSARRRREVSNDVGGGRSESHTFSVLPSASGVVSAVAARVLRFLHVDLAPGPARDLAGDASIPLARVEVYSSVHWSSGLAQFPSFGFVRVDASVHQKAFVLCANFGRSLTMVPSPRLGHPATLHWLLETVDRFKEQY
jgi:hypothetical protein